MNDNEKNQPEQSVAESGRKKYQVIFINWFDRSSDRILYETDENWEKQLQDKSIFDLLHDHGIDFNVEALIGTGVSIYFCEEIEAFSEEDEIGDDGDDDNDDDGNLRIKRGEIDYLFWVNDSSADFPLIEGTFTPGIYWEEDDLTYFELNDLEDFSRLFTEFLILLLPVELYKIICRENGAEMHSLEDNDIIREVKRFPFNYFDLYCPFCRQTVITHKIDSKHYPQCLEITNPCPHYIGRTVKVYDKFHAESLAEVDFIYKIDGEDLYIETVSGWKKLAVYDPPYEPEKSIHGEVQSHYRDVFIFLEN